MKPAASRHDVEELYRRHAEELRGYLHRRAGHSGADLLGEVFVVALQRLGDLPEPDLRRAWLFGTARRLLLATERNTWQRHHAENERVRVHEPAADASDDSQSDRARAVRDALASLREPDRELIRLTEWERLQITEAAMILGLRPGTARVRLHRARRALAAHPSFRGLLEPPTGPEPAPASAQHGHDGPRHDRAQSWAE